MSYPKGAIVRISLHNFLTYKSIEMFPGSKLNVMIGPNGSGKSSFICAIVLGLGGKPQIIGRSPHMGDYVKFGQESAKIEIELFNPSGHNFVITRTINSKGGSNWFLFDKAVTFKKIETVIEKLNIQVDNLCQMLPQDRVQDFAKMDKKQLLENTQKSIGCPELYHWFQKLKLLREELIKLKISINTQSKSQEDRIQKIQMLEADVQSFSTRRNMLNKIKVMKQKLAWLYYEEKLADRTKTSERLKEIVKELTDIQNDLKPLIHNIKEASRNEEKIRTKMKSSNSDLKEIEAKINGFKRNYTGWINEINKIKDDLAAILAAEKQREMDINNIKSQILEMEKNISQYSEETLINGINNCENEISALNKKSAETRYMENDVRDKASVVNQTIRALEFKINQANSVNEKKIELMSQYQDVYTAYNWIMQNKHEFNHPVYGPMFLELNVKNKEYARYVEHIIPGRDLIAFICEDAKDMSKALRVLRDKRNLKINVVHSSSPNGNLSDIFKPRRPVSELRSFGFKDYLIDLVEGPPSVIKYLCTQFRLYDIPFGDEMPYEFTEKIPSDIHVYFTGTKLIRINSSKYSGEKITLVTEIGNAKLLSISVNKELIAELNREYEFKKMEMESLNKNLQQVSEVKRNTEIELNKIRGQKRELAKNLEYRKSVCIRKRLKEDELERIEKNTINPQEEIEKAHNLIQKKTKEIAGKLKNYNNLFQKLLSVKKVVVVLEKELETAIALTSERELKSANLEESYKSLKIEHDKVKMKNAALKNEEKDLYTKAVSLSNGLNPDHPEFISKYLPQFKKISNNIPELEGTIHESETMARCLKNPQEEMVMKNYENYKVEVEKLSKELEGCKNRCVVLEDEIADIKGKWYPKLVNLIEIINNKFSEFFQTMRCVGVVELDKGTKEEEFENYGLSIKVKFRDEQKLQQLDSCVQSGGERALTTAVFMLSLQGITNVPFRCVDEINQGMDEFNERRVYELLTNSVSQLDTAQYFLLTPKLLPNLSHSADTLVHCIYNSVSAVSHKEWTLDKFLDSLEPSTKKKRPSTSNDSTTGN